MRSCVSEYVVSSDIIISALTGVVDGGGGGSESRCSDIIISALTGVVVGGI